MKTKATKPGTRRGKKGVTRDLEAKSNPKGGAAFDAFLEIEGIKGESGDDKRQTPVLKIDFLK